MTVAKLTVTVTGDTICNKDHVIKFPSINFQEPLMSMAVFPKSKGDEDKLSGGLSKLMEEDPTFKVHRDPVTREDHHFRHRRPAAYHPDGPAEEKIRLVDVELKSPKVPYKETIKGSTKVEHKYKKQTGGRGQYGHVCLEIDPISPDEEFLFQDKIVGGVVPKNYIPAVEKGVRKAMGEGVLAGYPVVGCKNRPLLRLLSHR